jgi:hypothetical protein
VGVVVASIRQSRVLPATALFYPRCCWAVAGWTRATTDPAALRYAAPGLWLPLKRRKRFRRLLAVFFAQRASAVPATLVLFFIQDLLHDPWSRCSWGVFCLSAPPVHPTVAGDRQAPRAGAQLAGEHQHNRAVFGWASQLVHERHGNSDRLRLCLVCMAPTALPGDADRRDSDRSSPTGWKAPTSRLVELRRKLKPGAGRRAGVTAARPVRLL